MFRLSSRHLTAARRRAASLNPPGSQPGTADDELADDQLADDDGIYDGPATVHDGDRSHHTRARLTGRIDPIDGHYHWQGTVFGIDFAGKPPPRVVIAIGDRTASARLTESLSRSTYSVVGVGAPPFELEWVEVEVPLL
ncbi:MAG: DUF4873 domain-containing protein [Mycolicibacterium sp.]|uniref:DUF4873 domain-containing protein n=1 Tax=Mycolicibacterium sp. TaxID=2320850 RepID=UPI003D127C18